MERIIQQLKEQRKKAEQTFIKNSFTKRNCKIDAPCPDVDVDLDAIGELNQAISILENYYTAKEPLIIEMYKEHLVELYDFAYEQALKTGKVDELKEIDHKINGC